MLYDASFASNPSRSVNAVVLCIYVRSLLLSAFSRLDMVSNLSICPWLHIPHFDGVCSLYIICLIVVDHPFLLTRFIVVRQLLFRQYFSSLLSS